MTSTMTYESTTRGRPAVTRERTFDVELVGHDPAALVRVLTMLRRRRCVINRVDFRVPDLHGPGWLTIGLEVSPTHGHAVQAWLANLVDVASVHPRA
jgi:acetolactate synthase regulatory subunit